MTKNSTTANTIRNRATNNLQFELNDTYADFSIKRLEGILDEGDEYVVNQYDSNDNFIKSYTSLNTFFSGDSKEFLSVEFI